MKMKYLFGGTGIVAALLLLGSAPAFAQPYGGGDCRDPTLGGDHDEARHHDRSLEGPGLHCRPATTSKTCATGAGMATTTAGSTTTNITSTATGTIITSAWCRFTSRAREQSRAFF